VQQVNPDVEPTPLPQYGGYGNPSTTANGGNPGYTPPMDIPLVPPGAYNFNIPNDGYNGPGSGVPTQRGIGLLGGLIGGGLGGFLVPGLGNLLGSKFGNMGAQAFVKWLQHHGGNAMPTQQQQPQAPAEGGPSGPNGGLGMPEGYDPFGGLPPGFTEGNRFGGGAPNFSGPGSFGPQWQGDSIFASHGGLPGSHLNPLMTPGGPSAISGSPGGELGDFGARLAMHSGRFRDAIQNMGYPNLQAFMQRTGFSLGQRGLASGQGTGGASRPMTKSY